MKIKFEKNKYKRGYKILKHDLLEDEYGHKDYRFMKTFNFNEIISVDLFFKKEFTTARVVERDSDVLYFKMLHVYFEDAAEEAQFIIMSQDGIIV